MTMQQWFNEVKGSKVEDSKGDIFTVVDVRKVNEEYYIGLLPIGGPVVYTNRYTYTNTYSTVL